MIPLVASRDDRLTARLTSLRPLHYSAGADESTDRPAHVRAGSGLTWVGDCLVVVQDDTSFLALVQPHDARVTAVPLPADHGQRQFDKSRGNKRDKLDLEAVATIGQHDESRVVAIGSGSKAKREKIVIVHGLPHAKEPDIHVHHAPALYAMLRSHAAFAGSEMNIEGAMFIRGARDHEHVLRVFNRGNGAPRKGLVPVNAWADLSWNAVEQHLRASHSSPPDPLHIVTCALGQLGDCALGFTDAALLHENAFERCTLFTAAAEASSDAVEDGAVNGSVIGVLVERHAERTLRWVELTDEDGEPFGGKVEGIAIGRGEPLHLHVVIDQDDHETPAQLGHVVLSGPWG